MTVEVGELLESVGFPENDVALLTAAGDLLVLDAIDEAIDALLVQVERSLGPVVQILQLVHVDETVERA